MKNIFLCLILLSSSVFAAEAIPPFAGHSGVRPIAEMEFQPVLVDRPGWEERSPEFIKWLSTGVRIGGGSGTMSFYDRKDNWMYVISCGHLFPVGMKSAEQYRKSPRTVTIEVFYHNDKKLNSPKAYKAEVLCHVWDNVIHDVSLMRFKPDWENPWTSPIVPKDYELQKDKYYHSVGCDGMSEVAHYSVKFNSRRTARGVEEIVTSENNARGGRSGGGLLTDEGRLFGICSRGGGGFTYFTCWTQVYDFLKQEGYEFVLKSSPALELPIVDKNNPQGKYENDYIAFPTIKHN